MTSIALFHWLTFSFCFLGFLSLSNGNRADNLHRLIKSRSSQNPPIADSWPELHDTTLGFSPVYIGQQNGLMQADKIGVLPGQPDDVNFDQYSGYVTVDPEAGRALFYYFVESTQDAGMKPLLLWLNGGPGCSTFGFGAMGELGPFRVNSDGKTLYQNNYAWNNDAWGVYDYLWTHTLNSDETNKGIHSYCNFSSDTESSQCWNLRDQASDETGNINFYNIYAPLCHSPANGSTGSINDFDPCSASYTQSYLNVAEVQTALHANHITWVGCRAFNWKDSPVTVLPVIKNLIANAIRTWIYSGDIDAQVPVTSTRYSINTLKLSIQTAWRPWYTNKEIGGYVVAYKGLTFATVRGAGHLVPSYQPERALTMISSFLQGVLPPSST